MSSRTIAVAESELSAILKGDNEIIEELEGDAVDRAERDLEIHNIAEAKAAEARAAARQARQLSKQQKLLAPKSPIRSIAETSIIPATLMPPPPPPSSSGNTFKISLKSAGIASATATPGDTPFKTPAPVDKMARSTSTAAVAATPSTPMSSVRLAGGTALYPETPATPDVAKALQFAPPTAVKSEAGDDDDEGGDKKLSKEERKAAKKAAKAAKKAAKAAQSGDMNVDDIDLMAIDVPEPAAVPAGGLKFKLKLKMTSSADATASTSAPPPPTPSAVVAAAPPPPPPTMSTAPVFASSLLAQAVPVVTPAPTSVAHPPTSASVPQPPIVFGSSLLASAVPIAAPPPVPIVKLEVPDVPVAAPPPPPVPTRPTPPPPPTQSMQQPSYVTSPAFVAATERVKECESKLEAAQKVLEADEAKVASAPNPVFAQRLQGKIAASMAARDAATAELNAARDALQAVIAAHTQ